MSFNLKFKLCPRNMFHIVKDLKIVNLVTINSQKTEIEN